MKWFETIAGQIEKDYEDGLLDDAGYRYEMKWLEDEVNQAAKEAAEEAYNDYLGF